MTSSGPTDSIPARAFAASRVFLRAHVEDPFVIFPRVSWTTETELVLHEHA